MGFSLPKVSFLVTSLVMRSLKALNVVSNITVREITSNFLLVFIFL